MEWGTDHATKEAIDQDLVMKALADFSKVFADIQPYKQKELLRLVLHKAILSPDYVKMALYGRPPEIGPLATAEPRTGTLNWLLGQDSNLRPSGGQPDALARFFLAEVPSHIMICDDGSDSIACWRRL